MPRRKEPIFVTNEMIDSHVPQFGVAIDTAREWDRQQIVKQADLSWLEWADTGTTAWPMSSEVADLTGKSRLASVHHNP